MANTAVPTVGSLKQLANYLVVLPQPSCVVIITHPSIDHLYGAIIRQQLKQLNWPYLVLNIPEGEKSKNLGEAKKCWHAMQAAHIDRRALVLALGGGVVTDLAGFVAACYMRGLSLAHVPTSLVAMIDAAIGAKVGVNLAHVKNGVGVFHPAELIFADPECLHSLPIREWIAGLAEAIKYGVIADPQLFAWLEEHKNELLERDLKKVSELIQVCSSIKKTIVEQDPFDKDVRASLNYGHTFGHALESLTHYRQYLHGEAVAIGMSCAAHLARDLEMVNTTLVERQDQLCHAFGLLTQLPPRLSLDRFIIRLYSDKKTIDRQLILILPKQIGEVVKIGDINVATIKSSLSSKRQKENIHLHI